MQPLWKSVFRLLKELEADGSYDTAMPSEAYTQSSLNHHRLTCLFMLIAVLITQAKKWNQYNGISPVEKNGIIKYAGIVLKLENIQLSKAIQAQKDKCHMLCLIGRCSLDLDLGVTWGTCTSQGNRNDQLHRGLGRS